MKLVRDRFVAAFPKLAIIKIDYIMNTHLYKTFDNTRREFKRLGKNTNEVILFHGTYHPKNIRPFSSIMG